MEHSKIIIDIGMSSIGLSLNELFYITTVKNQDHLLCFITDNENYYSRGILKNYEDQSSSLFRCHRSTIVNLQTIREIDRAEKKIYFTSEKEKSCIFSRRKLSSLTSQWKQSKIVQTT